MADIAPATGTPETAEEAAHAAAQLPPPKGLRIGVERKTRWIEIGNGARLRVRPLSPAANLSADFRAGRRLREEREADPDNPLLKADDFILGARLVWRAECLAAMLVCDWDGIFLEDGTKAELTPARAEQLMREDPNAASRFMLEITAPLEEIQAEGEG